MNINKAVENFDNAIQVNPVKKDEPEYYFKPEFAEDELYACLEIIKEYLKTSERLYFTPSDLSDFCLRNALTNSNCILICHRSYLTRQEVSESYITEFHENLCLSQLGIMIDAMVNELATRTLIRFQIAEQKVSYSLNHFPTH